MGWPAVLSHKCGAHESLANALLVCQNAAAQIATLAVVHELEALQLEVKEAADEPGWLGGQWNGIARIDRIEKR